MEYLYSGSAGGFYISGLHSQIPEDAVAITEQDHADLLAGQSAGLVIVSGKNGRPELRPRPEPTRAEIAAARQQAYADPIGGSDRHFAEAARLQVMGAPKDEIDAAKSAGVQRYEEIRAAYPWPNI